MTPRRWTLPLFLAVAALHLAPLCSVRYLPTTDGPTHVYNAWVLHGLVTGDAPPNIERYYKVDWKPHPNWASHVLMALAMTIVPPLVAEKLLVALIISVLLGGTWLLVTSVDPRNDLAAFLAFPFVWSEPLVTGFYNHTLGIGLFLIIVAVWWRRRNSASIGSMALLALLLVICNFTHPMATLLACGAIVLLSLLTRRFAQLLALLPVIPLLAMFGNARIATSDQPLEFSIDWDAALILARMETLQPWGKRTAALAIAVGVLYVALILFTLWRRERREANAIGVLALVLIAMMFWLPASEETRGLFTGRMVSFVFLVLPAWFIPLTVPSWRKAFAGVVTIIAVVSGAVAFERIHHFGAAQRKIVRVFDSLEPETTLLPLLYERPRSASRINVFSHVTSYVALEKRLVDLMNYETWTHYFPIVDRLPVPSSFFVEYDPGNVDLTQPLARTDYIVTYGEGYVARNRATINADYTLSRHHGKFRIYRRSRPFTGERELILLPLIGARDEVYGTDGARWKVVQTLHNRASRPLRVMFRECPEHHWCDRELAPGEVVPVETSGRAYAFIDVARDMSDFLDITTTVRRVDVDVPETSIPIPTVRERNFIGGDARVDGIPTRGRRVGLRVYAISKQPVTDVTMRLRGADGRAVAQWRAPIGHLGVYGNAELRSEVGGAELPDPSTIEIGVADDVRVWAFVTATDQAGRTQVRVTVPAS